MTQYAEIRIGMVCTSRQQAYNVHDSTNISYLYLWFIFVRQWEKTAPSVSFPLSSSSSKRLLLLSACSNIYKHRCSHTHKQDDSCRILNVYLFTASFTGCTIFMLFLLSFFSRLPFDLQLHFFLLFSFSFRLAFNATEKSYASHFCQRNARTVQCWWRKCSLENNRSAIDLAKIGSERNTNSMHRTHKHNWEKKTFVTSFDLVYAVFLIFMWVCLRGRSSNLKYINMFIRHIYHRLYIIYFICVHRAQ